MIPPPRWLLAAVLVALSLVAALLWAETQRWRPYYSAGDESAEARVLVNAQTGQPLQWAWAQGGLRRGTQLAWLRLAGAGLPAGFGSPSRSTPALLGPSIPGSA